MTHLRTDSSHHASHPSPRIEKIGWLIACTLAVALLSVGIPGAARAQSPLQESFRSAAERWKIPQGLLMAIGYVETRWEHQADQKALDGGVGMMHLTSGEEGTLARAARLTGYSEEDLRTSVTSNIEGAAAVLSDISLKLPQEKVSTNWQEVAAIYSGATDPYVSESYAADVLTVWREGRVLTIASGETITLVGAGDSVAPAAPEVAAPNSEDYPPALWVPAHTNNYTVGRPYGPLNFVVIHDTEGSYYSAINWFQNPNSRASAHYVIRSSDGQLTQMVREANTAWHAGNWDYNVRSLGIEHEGYMNQPGWYTEVMYQSSAALTRHMTDRYGIKRDRAHIIAHSEVPNQSHQDPGPYWDWSHYMSLVRRDWAYAARIDNTEAGFVPVPGQIDPQHYWWTHGGGYGGSNTFVTYSVDLPSESYNSGTWTTRLSAAGYYDVYAYIPWVDNDNADTSSARYRVYARDGEQVVVVSQRAITDRGTGSWAHIGRFFFDANVDARVALNDYTGETGRNVWFDAVMWIPATAGGTPPPASTPSRTPTRTPTRTATPTRTRTPLPLPTDTPFPTWTPGPCGMRFTDLPDTHWAYNYVVYLYCRNIIGGYEDGTFRPQVDSTRGQFVKMLVLGMGWNLYNPYFPTFSDVQPDNPVYVYVETANFRGVLGGYGDGTFRPNNPVTRAQAAKMLTTARVWPPIYPPQPSFVDVQPWHWEYGYVEAAFSRGIIGGYEDRTFRPHLHVTRAQLSKMLALTLQAAR